MLVVKLKDAMEEYHRRTGHKITYAHLSEMTGIAKGTLQQIGSRLDYHPTLGNIEKLCRALDVTPGFLLEIIDDPPKPKQRTKKKRAAGTKRE